MSDAAWSAWYRRALPAYWLFVLCCTHFPNLRLDLGVPSSDKLAHAAAFCVVGVSILAVRGDIPPPTTGDVCLVGRGCSGRLRRL